jgi:hypothetical protein
MISGVNSVSPVNYNQYNYTNNINFKSSKSAAKLCSLGIGALMMLSAISCSNRSDVKNPEPAKKDSLVNVDTDAIQNYYHYEATDGLVTADNYSWMETFYPDGSIKRDSMGYDIFISPKGERTVKYTRRDDTGNTTFTVEFPDGSKKEKTDYKIPNETLYDESVYWPNGKIKQRYQYNKYKTDSLNSASGERVDTALYKYNENGILLEWVDKLRKPELSDSNNVYDRFGRLQYDCIENEKFFYKGKNKYPYKSIAECENCKRYKIYNNDSTVKKTYFKAADGTITKFNTKNKTMVEM